MRLLLCFCALLGAIALGCQPQPPPASHYTFPAHSVTNGVCIVFATVPSSALVGQLSSAGAVISSSGLVFVFDIVNTAERRQAVQSALLSGAELKGAP